MRLTDVYRRLAALQERYPDTGPTLDDLIVDSHPPRHPRVSDRIVRSEDFMVGIRPSAIPDHPF